MANANSIEIFGTKFGPNEVFGPSTLRAMFGASLPFPADRTGAVSVAIVAAYLQHAGYVGIAEMITGSDLCLPGSDAAIEEF